MSLLNYIIKKNISSYLGQIGKIKRRSISLQNQLFKSLISTGTNTKWGKKYNYRNIKNYKDFCENVPLSTYDDLKPYIDRMIHGESNVLWPGFIKWFSKSSGTTTDRSKFIPISNCSLHDCHLKGSLYVLSHYAKLFPKTKLFEGKALILGGSKRKTEFNSKAQYGDLSAILIQNTPLWAEIFRTPSKSIALMDNWEEKIDKIAEYTMNQNITSISGVPSWMLIFLKRVLKLKGAKDIKEVWPNLELFMHGGVNFDPYVDQFNEIIKPGSVFYMDIYNASEGFFAFQDRKTSKEMMLVTNNGIFYEFIPMDELHKPNPKIISLKNVNMNTNYALVISTNAGLWRYIIGDTVQFTCLYPYRIKITGRTSNFINAFGEELIVENAEKAISEASHITGAKVNEYTAGPVYLSNHVKAAHEWLIEFEKMPHNLDIFVEMLDETLKKVNSDYDAKRSKDLLLQKPIVRVLPEGTFFQWLKNKGKLGGQNKVSRLSNNRKIIEEILSISEAKL